MRQDSESTAALLKPLLPKLYRLAFRLTGSRHDAQDLLQDVLVKIVGSGQELAALDNPGTWLGRVMYNHFVDDQRRYGRSPIKLVAAETDPDTLDTSSPTPEAAAAADESTQVLTRALERLSEDQRVVVLLHDAEGYTLGEIEQLTDTPIGTLKSRLHRARSRLAELLPEKAEKDGTFLSPASCKSVEGVKNDVV